MQIPTTFQTAGPFNLGGGEIAGIVYFGFIPVYAAWLLPRIARAFGEGLSGANSSRQAGKQRDDSPGR